MPVGYGSAFVPTQERRVTNLNPAGTGSLFEALTTPAYGSGVIVTMRSLSGSINRIGMADIIVDQSRITIAGDDANVTLIGCGMRFKANDLEMRNLRILPGDEQGTPNPDNRDCIGIEGNAVPQRIWIHHNTFGWSTDGLVDIWPGSSNIAPRQITIEDNIFTEALEDSIHTSGVHSTGLLIGHNSTDIFVHRNLFAHIARRLPTLSQGAVAAIVNNLYYNCQTSYEIYAVDTNYPVNPTLVDLIGNHYIMGPNSPWWRPAPGFTPVFNGYAANTKVYQNDNINSVHPTLVSQHAGFANLNAYPTTGNAGLVQVATPNTVLPITPMASSAVKSYVLANVGPQNKTQLETRVLAEVTNGTTGSIKNTPLITDKEFFGFPTVVATAVHFKGWDVA